MNNSTGASGRSHGLFPEGMGVPSSSPIRRMRLPRSIVFAIGLTAIVIIGLLDYSTEADTVLFFASLIPIILLTLVGGLPAGIVFSTVSAGTWLIIDIFTTGGYELSGFPLWNFFIRLAISLLCTFVIWQLNALRRQQRDLIDFIVHDLRTPLVNIGLEIDRLKSNECGPVTEKQLRVLETTEISCKRLASLVDSMLDLTQLEGGHAALAKDEIDIAALFAQAEKQLASWQKHLDIRIVAVVSADARHCIGDSALVLRILVNLLSNAIKASSSGSTITIESAAFKGGMIAISVTDEGKGMPSAFLKRAFDKFERGSRQVGGGIGLAFCKMAVEAHGGSIWLTSKKGEGTRACFTLPATRTIL